MVDVDPFFLIAKTMDLFVISLWHWKNGWWHSSVFYLMMVVEIIACLFAHDVLW